MYTDTCNIGSGVSGAQVMVQTSYSTDSKSTNMAGNAYFSLPSGSYQVSVTSDSNYKYQGQFSVNSLDDLQVPVLLPSKCNLNTFTTRSYNI